MGLFRTNYHVTVLKSALFYATSLNYCTETLRKEDKKKERELGLLKVGGLVKNDFAFTNSKTTLCGIKTYIRIKTVEVLFMKWLK